MNPLSSALAVLSAMITPAILISACGMLVLSTSNRLGRVVDRVRDLADKFEDPSDNALSNQQAAKQSMIFDQLDLFTNRGPSVATDSDEPLPGDWLLRFDDRRYRNRCHGRSPPIQSRGNHSRPDRK